MFRQPLGHWSTLVEGLQASPQECYAAIEEAIRRREIPDLRTSRVTFKESSFLSAERIYLRVGRKRLGFDICAAPFGNGFFFSWWLGELPPSNLLGCLVVYLLVGLGGYIFRSFMGGSEAGGTYMGAGETAGASLSSFQLVLLGLFLLLLVFWVVGKAVREGYLFSEDAILEMPFVGAVYDFIFRPPTYYKQDTIDMYQKAVHAAVLEAVDSMMSAKGLRALAPEARQPTLRDFLAKRGVKRGK
ncbi:MAG TPA: hypothetical protein VGX68_11320 [Thermoanaerobaculia bacterium]|nr:hypothetical protein [Thermoanaerobaculia bacterium]